MSNLGNILGYASFKDFLDIDTHRAQHVTNDQLPIKGSRPAEPTEGGAVTQRRHIAGAWRSVNLGFSRTGNKVMAPVSSTCKGELRL